jgi:hypothetical protein
MLVFYCTRVYTDIQLCGTFSDLVNVLLAQTELQRTKVNFASRLRLRLEVLSDCLSRILCIVVVVTHCNGMCANRKQ